MLLRQLHNTNFDPPIDVPSKKAFYRRGTHPEDTRTRCAVGWSTSEHCRDAIYWFASTTSIDTKSMRRCKGSSSSVMQKHVMFCCFLSGKELWVIVNDETPSGGLHFIGSSPYRCCPGVRQKSSQKIGDLLPFGEFCVWKVFVWNVSPASLKDWAVARLFSISDF